MRRVYTFITAVIVFLLQSVVLPRIFNGVEQPNLIFIVVVLVALRFGQRIGIGAALIGGFVQDVVIGNFFGIHIVPYLVLAFAASYVGRMVEDGQRLLVILLLLVATELNLVLTYAVLALSGQFISLPAYLAQYSIPLLLYHGILVLPADKAVRKMRNEEMYLGFTSYYG